MKSKVYFCKEITPENVVKLYQQLGVNLEGNVAVKYKQHNQAGINTILQKPKEEW